MFFSGRYGLDKLGKVMLFGSIGLYVVAMVLNLIWGYSSIPGRVVQGVALLLALLSLLRSLSRNFAARQRELAAYMRVENWFKNLGRSFKSRRDSRVISLNERRNFKHLVCPQCMQKLRVPRGKGRIMVTCTRCRCKFQART